MARWLVAHLGNDADVFTETWRKALSGVLGIGEVLKASSVQTQLQMLKV